MAEQPSFRNAVFSWMEDIIKCELPGMTVPVTNVTNSCMEEQNDCRMEHPPQVASLDRESFAAEFQLFVHRLAIRCNWHVHNDTCYKHLRPGEPRSDGNCRMRINGDTRAHTALDDETMSIQLRRLHPWINNYNDVLLFLLQSNMDIKYVGSGPAAKALVYYITDYITKSDIKIHAGIHTLQAAMKSHTEKFKSDDISTQAFRDRNLVTKCVNSLMGRQEVSHQQVMSYLVGGGDVYTSHEFRPFRFYECMRNLETYIRDRDGTTYAQDSSEENVHEWDSDDEITLDVSSGKPAIESELADYLFRPVQEPFNSMSLWEFIEKTRKVIRNFNFTFP
ncbi:hypothetical protein EV363DRAFT_1182651 [Boletus edulis]|nr:hypothetical protein EV363DRAFT_1182651 [Boletus edulis]